MNILKQIVAIAGFASASVLALAQETPVLDPTTTEFLAALEGATPIYTLSPEDARGVLAGAQSGPVSAPDVEFTERALPVGPTGTTRIRVYRPSSADGTLPAVVYFHGGGWVLGDAGTHERLMKDLSAGANAVIVFVDYDRSPEARYPVAIEQDYAVLEYVALNPGEFGVDANRIAIAGDSVGGNMTAAVSLMAKQRGGPELSGQLLFYPVTDAAMDSDSYSEFENGPWLTRPAMEWFWDQYLPDVSARDGVLVSPLNATAEQLQGLPPALVITAENDVLRDEGEAYARNLEAAGVAVTSTRYNHAIHDFVMLNALAENPATRAAIGQATGFLRAVLASD